MVLWGFPDADTQTLHLPIAIPRLLSLMIYLDADATVTGLDQIPRDEWPPIAASFYPYHLMVLLGGWFVILPWGGLLLGRRRFQLRPFLWALVLSLPLPWLAVELGWMAAEFGRQPWVVYGLLRTADAASVVVPAGQILTTIILFSLVYLLLLALLIYLLKREFDHGPPDVADAPEGAEVAA
jgi:cytochrome d ubiquinol oxidase subunit I